MLLKENFIGLRAQKGVLRLLRIMVTEMEFPEYTKTGGPASQTITIMEILESLSVMYIPVPAIGTIFQIVLVFLE